LQFIGGFENLIYEFRKDEQEYILRAGHSSHRTTDQVKAEIDWINYLIKNEITTPAPILSQQNNFVEIAPLDLINYLNLVVFEKVTGESWTRKNPNLWDLDIIKKWGGLTGKMHKLTRDYSPPSKHIRREEFENQVRLNPKKFLPESETAIIQIIENHLTSILSLPKTRDNYGLIHGDMHVGNFFVDKGAIWVFDFDDCEYKWFISDIAIPLYYSIYMSPIHRDRVHDNFAMNFLVSFLSGYRKHYQLPEGELQLLPDFIKLRDMLLCIVIHQMMDVTTMNEGFKQFLDSVKKRVSGKNPYIKIDIELLSF
jgi:Ser/Thr protein kinase RdoA (MazF antagonist)